MIGKKVPDVNLDATALEFRRSPAEVELVRTRNDMDAAFMDKVLTPDAPHIVGEHLHGEVSTLLRLDDELATIP